MSHPDLEGLVEYERDDNIVTLRLNRPDKLNAFSDELVAALMEALRRFDNDEDAHLAILTGNGRAFSSGADVHQRQLRSRDEFKKYGGPQAFGAHSSDLFTKAVNWKPVIAAPHGYVLGLANAVVFECDLVVAEEGTRFQITETPRGLGASKYWGLLNYRSGGMTGPGGSALVDHFRNDVIGGMGAFALAVDKEEEFVDALIRKLILEIASAE